MRVLIVGGDSKLGQAMMAPLLAGTGKNEIFMTTRRPLEHKGVGNWPQWGKLDLLDPHLPPFGFDVVYLLAAITKVVECEANPAAAWRTNADAPVTLGLAASRRGGHVVFVSSDAVEKAPNLLYSRTKAYAEGVLLSLGASILRPSVIGTPENFDKVAKILMRLGQDQSPGVLRWSP